MTTEQLELNATRRGAAECKATCEKKGGRSFARIVGRFPSINRRFDMSREGKTPVAALESLYSALLATIRRHVPMAGSEHGRPCHVKDRPWNY